MLERVDAYEATWIATGIVALLLSLWLAGTYTRDRLAIARHGAQPRAVRIAAWTNLRRETLRIATHACFLTAGGAAAFMLLPRAGIIVLLLIGQACIAANAALDLWDRRQLDRAVREWGADKMVVPAADLVHYPPHADPLDRVLRRVIGKDDT